MKKNKGMLYKIGITCMVISILGIAYYVMPFPLWKDVMEEAYTDSTGQQNNQPHMYSTTPSSNVAPASAPTSTPSSEQALAITEASSPTNAPSPTPTPLPQDLPAAKIINIESIGKSEMESYFYKTAITDELYQRIYTKSYKKNCSVPLEDLTYVKVLHYGFDEKTHIGELIVNAAIADTVIEIFQELYEAKYPIEKMVLIDEYDADDEASMEDNNSSSFNYRVIDGTTELSKHSLGIAIDINPLYNPYVRPDKGGRSVLPVNGVAYADRTLDCPYYIQKNDVCYQIFKKHGFTWGGDWKSSKDYQHFQISLE